MAVIGSTIIIDGERLMLWCEAPIPGQWWARREDGKATALVRKSKSKDTAGSWVWA